MSPSTSSKLDVSRYLKGREDRESKYRERALEYSIYIPLLSLSRYGCIKMLHHSLSHLANRKRAAHEWDIRRSLDSEFLDHLDPNESRGEREWVLQKNACIHEHVYDLTFLFVIRKRSYYSNYNECKNMIRTCYLIPHTHIYIYDIHFHSL